MIINHNVPGLVVCTSLDKVYKETDKASQKLSTGKKINSAADNAAGMAISNKMKTQVMGLKMAERNSNDAISLIQTAEAGLSEVQNMVQRMRELAVQGGNDTLVTHDRMKIQEEVNQLIDEIDDTAKKIQFNTKTLLDGSHDKFVFQVGPDEGLVLDVDMQNISATSKNPTGDDGLGLKGNPDVSIKDSKGNNVRFNMYVNDEGSYLSYQSRNDCDKAILACDKAIDKVSAFKAALGATQNRLEYTITSLLTSIENTETALSRVEDTDMAAQMTEYTKNNVIIQAGISMLSQANHRPEQLLSLLQ